MNRTEDIIKLNIKEAGIYWTEHQKFYILILKPVLDFLFAVFLTILTSPLLLAIAVAIKIDSKGPVFFKQERVGKNNKIFTLIKFRSMTVSASLEIIPSQDIIRITKVGNFIRKLSLDELPQLLNIINGNISFIGPRPLLIKYLPNYTNEQIKRHCVKPGISGWSQVNGRNTICWEDKFKFDVWYVNRINFILDLKIFFMTLWNIINRKGINNSANTIMPLFTGNNKSVDF
jgi:undecaprenyl phosphate N,N'-diacetylbacillosamine 1-phosphate transferase